MAPLATAVMILCAWSQTLCGVAQKTPMYQGALTLTDSRVLSEFQGYPPVIRVRGDVTDPAMISSLLAHETSNARQGESGGVEGCVVHETASYQAQMAEWQWVVKAFGMPAPVDQVTASYEDWMSSMGGWSPDDIRSWASQGCQTVAKFW